MAEISYLKKLVSELSSKIETLEKQASSVVSGAFKASPAEQLRLVLMGPPGSGEQAFFVVFQADDRITRAL